MNIRLNELHKTYSTKDGIIKAVDGISLEIPENTIFGIIGKSGAGKSSLVRLMSMLERCDSGEVYYDNERVDNLTGKALIERRRRIGMIFQNFNLFSSRTAAQNIAYPLEICRTSAPVIRERVAQMLSLVGLEDRGNAPVSTLSGGQKQRIAIARALATNPDILFCDEATSALDPQTTHSILELIRDIQSKMNLTVVMITHQMEVVRDACSQVAVIDDGKVVELGSVVDIFSYPKSSVTKEFIANITTEPSASSEQGLVRWTKKSGNYTLHFVGESTGEPVLSAMLHECDVSLNILAAGIQNLPQESIGTMEVDISGSDAELEKALAYLKTHGVLVEKKEVSE